MIEIVERNGLLLSLGTIPRPPDRAEDKYSRVKAGPPPTAADLSRAVSLVTAKGDPRSPVFMQGSIGSCSACSAKGAVETVRNYKMLQAGGKPDARPINPGPVYARARQRRGWFPEDRGSYMADCCDELLSGIYLLSDGPYSDNAAEAYPNIPFHQEYDYQLSHQPFYPSDGNTLEHIWLALSQGYAVQQACYWTNEWFAPKDGKMQAGITQFLSSAHATVIWGYIPGWLLCGNTWSDRWNGNAAAFGHDLRPGDFAMPVEYYRSNGPFFEFRVISGEMVHVEPEPQPQPDPQPTPEPEPGVRPEIINAKQKGNRLKGVVICANVHSDAALVINGVQSHVALNVDRFVVKLEPGRYSVVVRNPDGMESAPAVLNIVQGG